VLVSADETNLSLQLEAGERLPAVADVLLEGIRTVSFPESSFAADGRRRTVPWPDSLAAALTGRAALTVRDAVSGSPLGSADVVFPGSPDRLDLRDARGRWLSVNKWGRLAPSFDGMDARPVHERLLRRMDGLLEDLRAAGVDPFVCYGTLLGLVRDGRLIPHDDDADLAYLSAHEHPADVALESLAIERALRERGHPVLRHSGGHLQVRFDLDGALDHYIDVFTAFRTEGRTYLCFQVGDVDLDLSRLGTLSALGREFPVPVEAEALLAATYGPGWRVPDPSFTFTTPHAVRSRLHSWFGEFTMQQDHWQDFYSSAAADRVPVEESTFARWVLDRVDGHPPILDIGTGTARDARFFAMKDHPVTGVDYCEAAVSRAQQLSAAEGWAARFSVVNLADLASIAAFVESMDWGRGWHLYARFLVHAIDDSARANLWTVAALVARHGGECWLEFRTEQDAGVEKVFGEHFRRYLRAEDVVTELRARGLEVREQVEGQGLAPHRNEDPWVARLRVGAAA
jgi:SAM-dependent methyltransferase